MSYLKGKTCYLSGAIEHSEGPNWRISPKEIFANEFKVNIFDPFEDPKQQWSDALKEAKNNNDYEEMRRISKCFVRKDLCLVDRSDFLIAYLPYKVPTTGTIHEIINSSNAKKPTLLVSNGNKASIPLWLWGFIPHEVMFGCWEDLYTYLREVDAGKHKDNNRWAFIYGLV